MITSMYIMLVELEKMQQILWCGDVYCYNKSLKSQYATSVRLGLSHDHCLVLMPISVQQMHDAAINLLRMWLVASHYRD